MEASTSPPSKCTDGPQSQRPKTWSEPQAWPPVQPPGPTQARVSPIWHSGFPPGLVPHAMGAVAASKTPAPIRRTIEGTSGHRADLVIGALLFMAGLAATVGILCGARESSPTKEQ